MPTYLCDDGNAEVRIEATSAREAAQQYVDDGDWGVIEETSWIKVYVEEVHGEDEDGDEILGEREEHRIRIEPEEPECTDDIPDEHDWQSPIEVVGGIESNPGVWGHGGGVIIHEVCATCGAYRDTDTWAQDPQDGTQGLRSLTYRDADEASRAWLRQRAYEDVAERLRDIIEVAQDEHNIARSSIDVSGPDEGEEMLAEIRAALAPDYVADWTGNGNGDEMDIVVSRVAR
jgi:hypothetical protein